MYDMKDKKGDAAGQAKMDVLQALRQVAMDLIHERTEEGESEEGQEGLSDVKKVSVLAPDQEGLEKGLDMAEDVVGSMHEGDMGEEGSEGPSSLMEMPEEDDEASLMAKLEALRSKKKMIR